MDEVRVGGDSSEFHVVVWWFSYSFCIQCCVSAMHVVVVYCSVVVF